MRSRPLFLTLLLVPALAAAAAPARGDPAEERRSPVVRAVERARPGVVSIRTNEIVRVARYYNWFDYEEVPQEREGALGTGVIFHPQGYVITNAHVIARASKIIVQVTDASGRETERDAKTVSVDLDNDLAILRLLGDPKGGPVPAVYPYLPLGRSDDLLIGESVIAIGNPFRLGITVTTGVVSALRRSIRPNRQETTEFKDFIQIDAAINPGNSGGPIVDITGRWIGVNTAILNRATGAEGIGFAIPADRVREMVARTFKRRPARGDWLGFDLEAGRDGAPVVKEVSAQGPAAGTGLAKGDRILAVNGTPTPSLFDYRWEEVAAPADRVIALRVARGEKNLGEVRVTPATLPVAALSRQRLGFEARDMTSEDARTLGVEAGTGVVVTSVTDGGPAGSVGLLKDDVLLSLGEFRIRTLDDLATFVGMAQAGDAVDLRIQRHVAATGDRRGYSGQFKATLVAR